VAHGLFKRGVFAALVAVACLASGPRLLAQGSNTATASLGLTVSPADLLTISGGTTVSLKIRLGTGPAYLWGDSLSDCTSPIGTATTISTSGTYTPLLTAVPYNSTSNDYVCVYDPGTTSLNTSVAWPHNGLTLVFNQASIPNTAAGASISPAVTVQVKDSNGIPVPSSTASVTLGVTPGTPASGGPGTLSGTLTQSAVNGVATFSGLSINRDGTGYTLTATSSGLTSGTSPTFNITSSTLDHFAISTISSPQTAGTAFTITTITAQDADNNTVTSFTSTVTFSGTAGVTGTSAAFTAGVLTNASVTPKVAGSNETVIVTDSSGHTGSANIAAVNPGAASKLVYTTVPSTGTAGTAFSVTVQSQDANGNPASPTSATTIALSKATGGGTLSGVLTGSIPTNGNSVTISTPVYSKADTMTLTATATAGETSLTPITSGNIVFSAGAASQLVFTTQPVGGVNPGAALGTQPAVEVEDANGNPILSSPPAVTLAITSGTGNSAGTLNCTTNPVTPNTSTGIATFAGCSVSASGTGYTLTATTTSPSLSMASSSFTINGPTKLVFTTEPAAGALTAGACNTLTITSENSGGTATDPVGSAITVNLATGHSSGTFYSGSGCTGSITSTSISTSTSAVTVYYEDTTATGTGYTLTASTTTTGVTSATSNSYTVNAGAATKLVYTTVPSTGTAGTAFSVTVQSQDANGNPSSPTSSTTITLSKATGGGTLSGTLTGSIPTSGNSVTISTPVYSAADTMTLKATATAGETGLGSATSGNIVFSPGALNHFAISAITGTKTAGTAFTITTITAQDVDNNTVTSFTSTVTFGGTAGVTGTSAAFTAGVLSNASVTPTVAGSSLTVTVTSGSATGSATITTINAGVATKLVYTSVPSTGTAGTAFSVTVQSQDANGNPSSPTSNTTITLSKASGSGTLSGTLTGQILTSGNSVTISTPVYSAADTMTLTATATAGETSLAPVTSGNIVFSPGAATKLVFTTPPSSTGTGGTAWAQQPAVTVEDANGNTVTSYSTGVTLAINSGTGTLTCSANTVTPSSGVATFSGCELNKATAYTLKATSGSITSTTNPSITISAGTAAQLVIAGSGTQTAGGSQTITITAEDAGGNTATTYTGSKSLTFSGASNSPGGNVPTVTNSSGTATAFGSATAITFTSGVSSVGGAMVLYDAQSATVSASDGTISGSLSVTVSAATTSAGKSTVVANPTSVVADGATTSTITVTLLDAYSNPVSGKTVSLTGSTGTHSSISPSSGTSNSSGAATFTVKDTHAEQVVYTGKDTSDTVTVTQTATVTFTASKLAFISPPGAMPNGSCQSLVVNSEDANSDNVDPPSTESIGLSTTSSTGKFYSNGGCSTQITSTSIGISTDTVTFYYEDPSAVGNTTITAAGTGAFTNSATASFFVY